MGALAAACSAFVLLNLLELAMDGSVHGRDGRSDWSSFGERLGFVGVAVLFALSAVSRRHRVRGTCHRCPAAAHPPGTMTRVVRPPPPDRALGALAFLPHHTFLRPAPLFAAPGWPIPVTGSFRRSSSAPRCPRSSRSKGWYGRGGTVSPRFLPIVPVWLGGPTLLLYRVGGWVYTVLAITGAVRTGLSGADYILVISVMTAFGGYGWALVIAAVSYQRHTRPVCQVQARHP